MTTPPAEAKVMQSDELAELLRGLKAVAGGCQSGMTLEHGEPQLLWEYIQALTPASTPSASAGELEVGSTVTCDAPWCEGYSPWTVLALADDSAWIRHGEGYQAMYRSVDACDLTLTEARAGDKG
jgi:hypothetical protein